MKPTQSDVHVDKPLTSILVAYLQDESKGVATELFPNVPVQHKTDEYWIWDRADFERISVAERAPGTESEGGDFSLSRGEYNCKEYAIHKDIADPVRDNADEGINLEEAATRYVGHQLALKREKLFFSKYFTTSVWGTDVTGVAGVPGGGQFQQWDQAASKPIEVLRNYITAMEEATGYKPNKLLLGPHVAKALFDHPELIDRVKYTQRGVSSPELLAELVGLEKVLVGRLIENTAKEGQTAAYSYISGKSALLVYAPAKPSIMEPSAGYTFSWTKRPGAGPNGERIKKFRMENIESDRVEGQMNFDMQVVCSDLGVFFNGAVA